MISGWQNEMKRRLLNLILVTNDVTCDYLAGLNRNCSRLPYKMMTNNRKAEICVGENPGPHHDYYLHF